MSDKTSRRDFVGLSAAGVAALSHAMPASAQTPGPIAVRQTAGAKRFAEEPGLKWQPATGGAPADAIVVDTTKTYQEMLGFGASLTDASAYMINQLDPAAREKFLHELYDPSELGISVTRLCIGSSDYATKEYTYDDGDPDPDMKRFSIDHDKEYILPQLRLARKFNPSLFLLACPWSPPGWMKVGGSMLGGTLKPENFPAYAKYFVKFLQSYEAEGIRVDAVTSQNEVDTDQLARVPHMPACLWAQEHEITFVGQHLGPALEQNKLQTKIWLLDHNFNLWGRVINMLENPAVNRYVDGVAWHVYVGSVTAMTRVHDAFPDKHQYWTEGSFGATANLAGNITFGAPAAPAAPGAPAPPKPRRDLTSPAVIARAGLGAANAVRNWVRCMMFWNVVLDENGNPNIGPARATPLVVINSKTKELTRNGDYWAMKHYNHAARCGAKRVDSQGSVLGVAHVAFVNPDGRKSLVLTNTGADSKVQVRIANVTTEVSLPENSITNLSWV
jgi:glucosylceramidase